ncbi:MAG: hypothetical protein NWF05_04900 [Candidatus Bathyarchaeota archaeon]|nr:hypothetical protein [Candidatus Bathyarchaeota archaeon]
MKNKENTEEFVPKVPIKKVFVKVGDNVTLQLDQKTLEHYGDDLSEKDHNYYFQKSLSMPSKNLASIGLPYRGTGTNNNNPYVEFFGKYEKGELKISIKGKKKISKKQNEAYEYSYSFENDKEFAAVPVDFLVLRLDRKSYFFGEKLLFDSYKEVGVISAEGALPSKVFLAVCRAFSSLWQEKIKSEELKEYSRFSFQIVILPFSLLPNGKITYRSDEASNCSVKESEDSFGNQVTGYTAKRTQTAKFFSFNDPAFSINCRTGKEFYQNLDIGDQTVRKINLSGLKTGVNWYFYDVNNPSFQFENTRSGIYDRLLNNYNHLIKQAGEFAAKKSTMKIIFVKKTQAKLEVLLDENLTFDQLKQMLSRAQDNLAHHPMALESLIIKRKNDIVWTDYLTAIRHFLNGTFVDRTFLVQRFTLILWENLREWIKGNKPDSKAGDFFEKSQFCLNLLTKTEGGLAVNKNEKYAYKIGCIAGKYVKFKREKDEANNSTKDILTYSRYDLDRLKWVYQRACNSTLLSKADYIDFSQSIKNDIPEDEIEEEKAHEDYSYFFYKGVFQNLT